jgi:aminopeptidase N
MILSSSLALSQAAGGPHNYVEQQFDVIEYRPIITIEDHKSKFIRGEVNINLEWKTISEDNLFHFHNEDLTIDSIFYDDVYISETILTTNSEAEGILYYSIKPTNQNKQASIRIKYHGTMTSEGGSNDWGGVHYSQGILYAMGVGFFNDYVSCTRHWMPSFDLPSDKALYTGAFIVPDSLMAISNGKLFSKVDTLEGMSKYTWTLGDDVAATYLLTFAVGKFAEVEIPNSGKPPVKLYMYDNQNSIESGELVFKLVPEMITAFEQFFDYDYPFETMGYYAASKGAMEHQTLVTMSNSQIVGKAIGMDTMYSTAAHELGHQWFGNLVTPYDFRDAWLNEGFAVFTEYVWIESKLGSEKYREELMKLRSSYINNTAKAEQHIPLYNFHRFSKNNYPSTIYQKGGLILALIRDVVGDEIFKARINQYLRSYENANTTTKELSALFFGVLPQSFWDTWVYGRGFLFRNIHHYQ